MVTLDERVEAMMTLNNRNWKDTSSPARRGTGSRNESSGRLLDRDAYFSRPDYSDSSRVQDDDSLIKSDYGIYEKHRRPSYEQDDNCLLKCGRCLARIPCSAVCCWVFLCTAVAMCCGGVLVSAYKGQDMLDTEHPDLVNAVLFACVGVLLCMVFLGTWFLVVAVLSSGKTCLQVFNSRRKNTCARVLNGIMICVMLLIQLLWTLVSALLILPVACMAVVHYLYYNLSYECIDLKYYGLIHFDPTKLCGNDLERMMFKSHPVFVGLVFAFVGAVLTVKSMTFFLLCASSNMTYLRESRFIAYSQQNCKRASTLGSHQDTKM